MTRWLLVLVAAAVGATTVAVVSSAEAPSDAVRFPAGFDSPIYVGDDEVYAPEVEPSSTTTSAATTTTVETTTTSEPPTTESTSTTSAPESTTTTATVPSTTSAPPPTGGSGCGSSAAAFCEDFADPASFPKRFDKGWSGELHAGSLFGADRNGWMADHDGMCGNPNLTHRQIILGPGNHGQTSPQSAEPAFYACLPGDDPTKGHVMTTANTEGYIIAWFSPKAIFTDVRKVCTSIDFTWLGNGIWWQMVFLTRDEYLRTVFLDGQTVRNDLGFTSPDFPNNGGPSTHQGTAANGVKFMVNGDDTASSRFIVRPWSNGAFTNEYAAGPGTGDHAPRFPVCVQDNENGTLTITNGSPDGRTYTRTVPGQIPNGEVRVVFEHDEYNPDKHHRNSEPQGIAPNTGEGYVLHWDDVLVATA